MHTVGPCVSCERTPEVFICQHIETPAPIVASVQLSSSMWTRIGGSHHHSMDISVFFLSSQLFHEYPEG